MERQQQLDRLKIKILDLLSDGNKHRASEIWEYFERHFLIQVAIDELLDRQSISREECEIEIQGAKRSIEQKTYRYFIQR